MKSILTVVLLAIALLSCGRVAPPFSVKRVATNGIHLAVAEAGKGDEAIVFLHHGGGNLSMWQRFARPFMDDYRLIFIDQRGHGRSDKPEAGNHIDTLCVDVAGVMDALQVDKAHVLGASLGAEVALALAAHYPDRVKTLVLEGALHSAYGPYSPGEKPESDFDAAAVGQWTEIPVKVWANEAAMLDSMKAEYGAHWSASIEAYLCYGAHRLEDGRLTEGWIKPCRDAYIRHYFSYRFEDYYPRVQCPVLMLPSGGEFEDKATRRAMERLAALGADTRIKPIPDLMHAYGWLVTPEILQPVVVDFLAKTKD